MVSDAIGYIKTNPPPFSDRDLVRLGRRLASDLKCGKWQRNSDPLYNEQHDKALIDLAAADDSCRHAFGDFPIFLVKSVLMARPPGIT